MLFRRSAGVCIFFSYLVAGCGLSDYEKRVDQQIVALKRFDEENKALEDPLDMPLFVDPKAPFAKPVLWVEFYLRPPKGTATKATGLEDPKPGTFPLVRYPGPAGFNVLVSTARIDAGKGGKPLLGAMTPKEFQHQVRQALAGFYAKEFKRGIDWSTAVKTEKKSVAGVSPKGTPINLAFDFQTLTDDPDPTRKTTSKGPKDKVTDTYHDFRLYFYQTGNEQAAITYQIPASRRNDGEVRQKEDFSIQSLALAAEANIKRDAFRRRKR
jgi:hypothetical protein